MWLDALLAYLHFSAVFALFAFLTVEVVVSRATLDAARIHLLARADLWYFGAAIVALATGAARILWGAKGWDFYAGQWAFHAKMALYVAVGVLSALPTRWLIRWRKAAQADGDYVVPEAQRRRMRRYVMLELHLAALIPVMAVIMSRGLGR